MGTFRDRMIAWLQKRGVRMQSARGARTYEARLKDDLPMLLRYDPAHPEAAALLRLRLVPLPFDMAERKLALSRMLEMNMALAPHLGFGLRLSDGGAYISLEHRPLSEPVSDAAFRRAVLQILGRARAAREKLTGTRTRAAHGDSIRYL